MMKRCTVLVTTFVVLVMCFTVMHVQGQAIDQMFGTTEDGEEVTEVLEVSEGTNVTLQCIGIADTVSWKKGHHNITDGERHSVSTEVLPSEGTKEGDPEEPIPRVESILYISDVVLKDTGRYHCVFIAIDVEEDAPVEQTMLLKVKAAPKLLLVSNANDTVVGGKSSISCTFSASPSPAVTWIKDKTPLDTDKRFKVESRSENNLHISMLLLDNATLKDNGSYHCHAENAVGPSNDVGAPYIIVHTLPTVKWNLTRSVGPQEIQLKWDVHENQAKVQAIEVWISDDLKESSATLWETLDPSVRSVVLDDGIVDAAKGGGQTISAWLKIKTASGHEVVSSQKNVTMLEKVPLFVPAGSFRGSSLDSLTVGWTKPPKHLVEYVSYYILSLSDFRTGETQKVEQTVPASSYRFYNLNPGTPYNFSLTACMGVHTDVKRDCGPPSSTVSGNTLYNYPNMVEDAVVTCSHNDYNGWSVEVKWKPSTGAKEQGSVDHYKLELKSIAQYVNEEGQQRYEDDKREERVSANFTSYTFPGASANTRYVVKVYAGIRHMYSKGVTAQCVMPVWLPRQYDFQWWISNPPTSDLTSVTPTEAPRPALLKLPAPAVSQRNGTICCYRIVVVKLANGEDASSLAAPNSLNLTTHEAAHHTMLSAAYVAEAYSRAKERYLVLGDQKTVEELSTDGGCSACLQSSSASIGPAPQTLPSPSSTVISFTTSQPASTTTVVTTAATSSAVSTTISDQQQPPEGAESSADPSALPLEAHREARSPDPLQRVVDGELSPEHNYTGFLILSVQNEKGIPLHRYSSYFNTLRPVMSEATTPEPTTEEGIISHLRGNTALLALIGILALLIVVTLVLCCAVIFYQRRNKRFDDEFVYNESLTGSLGKIFRTLRKSNALMSPPSIDVKPIAKDKLVEVYLENVKDSELGFRREYEALPEKFVDRSSRTSELLENFQKNRYPDIKAYDQTRVKLTTSVVHPSDYINANFVLGYKERKKFICAQGPMDATVDDFWRMIVEQGCGICVMLTNLEENGKVKCVKYWPEAGQPKTFGNITVRLVKEKSYADYIVRTLRAEWMVQTTSSSSNHIGSSNDLNSKGVVGGEGSTSTNTSNASNSPTVSEEMKYHEVQQYHYLVWRDFVAPEHPVGILAFLKRMNEAYSTDKGPLLVHCSAGVGRTGTLVALDSLVMELDEEQQSSVYNLICDLRHQRNFLVQSLKQYVFIHRALMEYAQFGCTEQTPQQLREAYVKHMNHIQQQVSPPLLQTQFDLLSKVIEERKAFAVATSEENKARNRYDFVLPYDSNRVILSPVAGKPLNTYINASFVSGFDLDEHFIVTQDPLDNTVGDFWRMIYEQDVTTMVMLSELGSGENLCTRYWPEEEEEPQYEMIRVKLLSSESYPKFSSRVFQLTNTKSGDTRQVTQFQYIGWSGQMGEVPVGTYGIMEVINRVQSHIITNLSASMPTPVLLHCSGGGDRCSVYVCLNNCLRQLRREGRVDVFQIARKIRSQRQFMLQELSQYEFCYKALIEYIDSKGLDNI